MSIGLEKLNSFQLNVNLEVKAPAATGASAFAYTKEKLGLSRRR